MENSWRKLIDSSESILILLPTRPFFDQVAAGLSLYFSIRGKKDTAIYCPSEMTVEFNRLVGINKISHEMGNKNLVIKFSDYEPKQIERVSADIEDDKFKLSVIPKPGVAAPEKNQVELGYSGVSADTVVLVGGANESHFPAVKSNDLAGAKVAHIGVKDLELGGASSFMSFSIPAASVCEIAARLIDEGGLLLDDDVATNLLMGIEEKTSNFTSKETNANTFEIVAKLLRAGGRRNPPKEDRSKYPPGAIPETRKSNNQGFMGKSSDTPKDWLKPKIFKGSSSDTK